MIFALALAAQALSIGPVLDRVVQAEEQHPKQTVAIEITADISPPKTVTHLNVSMDRSALQYVVSVQKGAGRGRVYFFSGTKLVIYDRDLDEYEIRTVPKGSSVGSILVYDFHLEPSILLVVDPKSADDILFKPLRKMRDWRFGKSGGELTIGHRTDVGSRVSLVEAAFSANTMLPSRFYFGSLQHGDSSTFASTGRRQAPSFSPPTSARRVERFSSPPLKGRYQSASALNVSNACIATYKKLRWLVYKSVSGTESNLISWHGVQARQQSPSLVWAYDGQVLTAKGLKSNKFVRVITAPEQISNYLSPFGSRIDPSLQTLMEGDDPLDVLYKQKMNVRLVGDISLNGVAYNILEARNNNLRVQVRIRKDNHLIGGFLTENTDLTGHVLARSERSFTYFSVNKPLTASTFSVRP